MNDMQVFMLIVLKAIIVVIRGLTMRNREIIKLEVDGHTGTAEIKWISDNEYSVAHYAAFISVPFQDSKWEHLFIYDEADLEGAIAKANVYLETTLQRCTLC